SALLDEGQCPIEPQQYGVIDCGEVRFTLPSYPGLVTVALQVVDGGGAVRARNYVNVDVTDEVDGGAPLASLVSTTRTPEGGYAIAFAPEAFVDCSWANPIIGQGDAKFGGPGAGWVEYALPLPQGLDPQRIGRLRLLFEAGARTARSRLGWADPAHIKLTDYPQTEARKRPSRVVVSIDGRQIGEATLPDDPADARGVLSFQAQRLWELGSYGFALTLTADEATTRALLRDHPEQLTVRFEVPRGPGAGGLNLYGSRAGAFPFNPTMLLD
ncbi:MAG TPA: hypothetical protein VHQ00_14540, partial [Chloroflexota bacterium]|nr:hypothetical protein [Chloroflexota bacterium]